MYKDGIINLCKHEDLEIKTVHYNNTQACIDTVQKETELFWSKRSNQKAFQNYEFGSDADWSLENLLKNQKFELGYTLLYINDQFYAGGGIRALDDKTTISLSRFFCKPSPKPLGNAFILPLHIELSRRAGFAKTIITFNQYNEHLVRYYSQVLKTKKDSVSQLAYKYLQKFQLTGLQEINNVQQYVFEYDLS